MADDEFLFLREMTGDEELAQEVANADKDSAVALLLKTESGFFLHPKTRLIFATMLWRNRTGEDSNTAHAAVVRIAEKVGMRVHTDEASGNVSLIQQEAPTGEPL